MAVKPIPDGYHTVTPYLVCNGAAAALEFYKKALGAKVLVRMDGPGGKVGHAEVQIGDSRIMLADPHPEGGAYGPDHLGGTPVRGVVYVENVDAVVNTAVAAGAKLIQPVAEQFYGDRTGNVVDPFGHQWFIHTHVRDVTPEEMKQAMK